MTKNYFKTSGFIPGGIIHNTKDEAMDMQALPPFLRTLLVADGTVTKSLGAYFWERIEIELRGQNPIVLEQDLPLIDAVAGTEILQREVTLIGSESRDVYCYASSYIRFESLREDLRPRLINGEIGIGELLREVGLETYREIVDFDRASYVTNSADHPEVDTVNRVYVIKIGGKAAIQIIERFPYSIYQQKL